MPRTVAWSMPPDGYHQLPFNLATYTKPTASTLQELNASAIDTTAGPGTSADSTGAGSSFLEDFIEPPEPRAGGLRHKGPSDRPLKAAGRLLPKEGRPPGPPPYTMRSPVCPYTPTGPISEGRRERPLLCTKT